MVFIQSIQCLLNYLIGYVRILQDFPILNIVWQ